METLPALTDMLYLCHEFNYWSSRPPDSLPLEGYGWDARAREGFLHRFADYSRAKGQRYRVRLRILLNHAFSGYGPLVRDGGPTKHGTLS